MDPLNIAPGQTPLIADVYSYTGPRLFTSRRRVLDAGVKSTSRFQDDFGGWPVCVRSALCLRPMTKNGRRVFGYLTKPEFTRVSPARQRAEGVADECGTRSSTVPSKPMTGLPPMDHAIVWLPGTTLLIDTQSHFPEFGVIVARALQSRTLADAAAEPVDRVLWYQQPRYPSHSRPASLAMTQLVVGVMANYSRKERSVHRDDVAAWKLVCLERAVEVPFMYDRPFANDAGLQRWMALRKAWNPSGALVNGHAPCPGSNVAVLQRDGTASGDGARPLSDYAVLGRVLGSLGVCAYRNVSNVHCQASLAQQASVFESYGLMLSPYACRACTRANAVPPPLLPPRASHSSQLRNIIWAHPLSSTLELVRTAEWADGHVNSHFAWGAFVSPFCVDNLCPSLYAVSFGHGPADAYDYNGVVEIHAERLRVDLAALLERQRKALRNAGCELPAYLRGLPCAFR